MSFEEKYLKYKSKYLNSKNQLGGDYKDGYYRAAGILFTDEKHILAGYQKGKGELQYEGGNLNGIGGTKDELYDNNDAKITAIREMLEELFNIFMKKDEEIIPQNAVNDYESNNTLKFIQLLKSCDNIQTEETNIIAEIKKQIGLYKKIQLIKNDTHNKRLFKLIMEIYNKFEMKKYLYYFNYVNFIYSFEDMKILLAIINSYGFSSPYYDTPPHDIYDIISMRKQVKKGKEAIGEVAALSLLPIQEDVSIDKNFISDIKYYFNKDKDKLKTDL